MTTDPNQELVQIVTQLSKTYESVVIILTVDEGERIKYTGATWGNWRKRRQEIVSCLNEQEKLSDQLDAQSN